MPARGLSDLGAAELGPGIVDAWDAFLDVVTDPATDLARASRLAGWSGKDVCAHLGQWPGHDIVEGVVSAAQAPDFAHRPDRDEVNARLVLEHRGTPTDEVVAALLRARESLAEFFDRPEADDLGRLTAPSDVGELPVLSLLHASTYELAVHALDLQHCGAPPPPPVLLDRGLAALIDVTGALCARAEIDIALTAQTPAGGWRLISDPTGWSTERTPCGQDLGHRRHRVARRPARHLSRPGQPGSAADDPSPGRAPAPVVHATGAAAARRPGPARWRGAAHGGRRPRRRDPGAGPLQALLTGRTTSAICLPRERVSTTVTSVLPESLSCRRSSSGCTAVPRFFTTSGPAS